MKKNQVAISVLLTSYLINILITSLTSFIASFMNAHNVVTLLWVYFLLMFLSAAVYWGMIRDKS